MTQISNCGCCGVSCVPKKEVEVLASSDCENDLIWT